MAGKRSHYKGMAGEHEVVKLARRAGFKKAERTAPMQAGHAKEHPDVTGVSLCWVEVKRARRVNIRRAFRALEVLGAAFPVLVHRDDRDKKWRATLHYEQLLTLLKRK